MSGEVAAWKAQQRAAMSVQLQLEEESLARLEAAAAANGGKDISIHGMRGPLPEVDEDEAQFDKPGWTKVGSTDTLTAVSGLLSACLRPLLHMVLWWMRYELL